MTDAVLDFKSDPLGDGDTPHKPVSPVSEADTVMYRLDALLHSQPPEPEEVSPTPSAARFASALAREFEALPDAPPLSPAPSECGTPLPGGKKDAGAGNSPRARAAAAAKQRAAGAAVPSSAKAQRRVLSHQRMHATLPRRPSNAASSPLLSGVGLSIRVLREIFAVNRLVLWWRDWAAVQAALSGGDDDSSRVKAQLRYAATYPTTFYHRAAAARRRPGEADEASVLQPPSARYQLLFTSRAATQKAKTHHLAEEQRARDAQPGNTQGLFTYATFRKRPKVSTSDWWRRSNAEERLLMVLQLSQGAGVVSRSSSSTGGGPRQQQPPQQQRVGADTKRRSLPNTPLRPPPQQRRPSLLAKADEEVLCEAPERRLSLAEQADLPLASTGEPQQRREWPPDDTGALVDDDAFFVDTPAEELRPSVTVPAAILGAPAPAPAAPTPVPATPAAPLLSMPPPLPVAQPGPSLPPSPQPCVIKQECPAPVQTHTQPAASTQAMLADLPSQRERRQEPPQQQKEQQQQLWRPQEQEQQPQQQQQQQEQQQLSQSQQQPRQQQQAQQQSQQSQQEHLQQQQRSHAQQQQQPQQQQQHHHEQQQLSRSLQHEQQQQSQQPQQLQQQQPQLSQPQPQPQQQHQQQQQQLSLSQSRSVRDPPSLASSTQLPSKPPQDTAAPEMPAEALASFLPPEPETEPVLQTQHPVPADLPAPAPEASPKGDAAIPTASPDASSSEHAAVDAAPAEARTATPLMSGSPAGLFAELEVMESVVEYTPLLEGSCMAPLLRAASYETPPCAEEPADDSPKPEEAVVREAEVPAAETSQQPPVEAAPSARARLVDTLDTAPQQTRSQTTVFSEPGSPPASPSALSPSHARSSAITWIGLGGVRDEKQDADRFAVAELAGAAAVVAGAAVAAVAEQGTRRPMPVAGDDDAAPSDGSVASSIVSSAGLPLAQRRPFERQGRLLLQMCPGIFSDNPAYLQKDRGADLYWKMTGGGRRHSAFVGAGGHPRSVSVTLPSTPQVAHGRRTKRSSLQPVKQKQETLLARLPTAVFERVNERHRAATAKQFKLMRSEYCGLVDDLCSAVRDDNTTADDANEAAAAAARPSPHAMRAQLAKLLERCARLLCGEEGRQRGSTEARETRDRQGLYAEWCVVSAQTRTAAAAAADAGGSGDAASRRSRGGSNAGGGGAALQRVARRDYYYHQFGEDRARRKGHLAYLPSAAYDRRRISTHMGEYSEEEDEEEPEDDVEVYFDSLAFLFRSGEYGADAAASAAAAGTPVPPEAAAQQELVRARFAPEMLANPRNGIFDASNLDTIARLSDLFLFFEVSFAGLIAWEGRLRGRLVTAALRDRGLSRNVQTVCSALCVSEECRRRATVQLYCREAAEFARTLANINALQARLAAKQLAMTTALVSVVGAIAIRRATASYFKNTLAAILAGSESEIEEMLGSQREGHLAMEKISSTLLELSVRLPRRLLRKQQKERELLVKHESGVRGILAALCVSYVAVAADEHAALPTLVQAAEASHRRATEAEAAAGAAALRRRLSCSGALALVERGESAARCLAEEDGLRTLLAAQEAALWRSHCQACAADVRRAEATRARAHRRKEAVRAECATESVRIREAVCRRVVERAAAAAAQPTVAEEECVRGVLAAACAAGVDEALERFAREVAEVRVRAALGEARAADAACLTTCAAWVARCGSAKREAFGASCLVPQLHSFERAACAAEALAGCVVHSHAWAEAIACALWDLQAACRRSLEEEAAAAFEGVLEACRPSDLQAWDGLARHCNSVSGASVVLAAMHASLAEALFYASAAALEQTTVIEAEAWERQTVERTWASGVAQHAAAATLAGVEIACHVGHAALSLEEHAARALLYHTFVGGCCLHRLAEGHACGRLFASHAVAYARDAACLEATHAAAVLEVFAAAGRRALEGEEERGRRGTEERQRAARDDLRLPVTPPCVLQRHENAAKPVAAASEDEDDCPVEAALWKTLNEQHAYLEACGADGEAAMASLMLFSSCAADTPLELARERQVKEKAFLKAAVWLFLQGIRVGVFEAEQEGCMAIETYGETHGLLSSARDESTNSGTTLGASLGPPTTSEPSVTADEPLTISSTDPDVDFDVDVKSAVPSEPDFELSASAPEATASPRVGEGSDAKACNAMVYAEALTHYRSLIVSASVEFALSKTIVRSLFEHYSASEVCLSSERLRSDVTASEASERRSLSALHGQALVEVAAPNDAEALRVYTALQPSLTVCDAKQREDTVCKAIRDATTIAAWVLQAWHAKPGTVLDEWCENIASPGDDDKALILAKAGWVIQRRIPNERSHSKVELVAMLLYTMAAHDIDSLMGYSDVPSSDDQAYTPRNAALFRVLNSAMRGASACTSLSAEEWPGSDIVKWVKTIVLLTAVSSAPAEHPVLYRGLAGLPSNVVSEHGEQATGDVMLWSSLSSCSLAVAASRAYLEGVAANATAAGSQPGSDGCLLFRVSAACGLPLRDVSKYPSEEEVLLPCLSLLRVTRALATDGSDVFPTLCARVEWHNDAALQQACRAAREEARDASCVLDGVDATHLARLEHEMRWSLMVQENALREVSEWTDLSDTTSCGTAREDLTLGAAATPSDCGSSAASGDDTSSVGVLLRLHALHFRLLVLDEHTAYRQAVSEFGLSVRLTARKRLASRCMSTEATESDMRIVLSRHEHASRVQLCAYICAVF